MLHNLIVCIPAFCRPDGTHSLHKPVPTNLTTWSISAFSLDPITGLALTAEPTRVRVFSKFFVALDLPYALKLGEIVAIPVVVHNYGSSPVEAEVTLHNEQQDFDFISGSWVAEAAPSELQSSSSSNKIDVLY